MDYQNAQIAEIYDLANPWADADFYLSVADCAHVVSWGLAVTLVVSCITDTCLSALIESCSPRQPRRNIVAFVNVYEDAARAEAYSKLEFANTYYLAFRGLPEIAAKCAQGRAALDFGCGTGRSSRFLRRLGFEVTSIDISEDMLRKARQTDPRGDYRLAADGDLGPLAPGYDLALSAFTFDNIPAENKLSLFKQLARLLKPQGVLVNLVSSPEIYWHEWASFSTRDYAVENRKAKSGDTVLIVTTDFEDRRPCADVLCADDVYKSLYAHAGLQVVETRRPLATGREPYRWISETTIAPWVIWVLRPESPT